MRKSMAVLIVIIMAFLIATPASSAPLSQEEIRNRNEVLACEQYQQLLTNLSIQNHSQEARSLSVDYFGGAYVNDDGNLVVCVTEDYDRNSKTIESYTGNDDIILRNVNHSYEELAQEQDRIWAVRAQLLSEENNDQVNNLLTSLCGTCVIQKDNTVVVSLKDMTDEKILLFRKLISNAEFLVFNEADSAEITSNQSIQSDNNDNEYTNSITRDADDNALKPGCALLTEADEWISMGYPVYYINSDGEFALGFVTVASYISLYEQLCDTNMSAIIGYCRRWACSGSANVALIEVTNPEIWISYTTHNGCELLDNVFGNAPEGSDVYMDGWAYQNIAVGPVVSTNATYTLNNGTVISNLIKVDYATPEACSGGPVYRDAGLLVGSIAATSTRYTYVCRIDYALEALYCQLWYCNGDGCEDWDCLCNNHVGQT